MSPSNTNAPTPSDAPTSELDHHFPNRFALMLFCQNIWGGLTATLSENRWDAKWENNRQLAIDAEAAGLEAMIPLGNWLGYGGSHETGAYSYESLIWAAGLLEATEKILVFATVHVPFLHPVFAAKQIVTCSHIGKGRFGLNVVSGANLHEFELFGTEMLDHDERYVVTREWLDIVKRAWIETEPFDFVGQHFNLQHVISRPAPYNNRRPIIVSAGSSPAGRAFAAQNADCLFLFIPELDALPEIIATTRQSSTRSVRLFSSGTVFCKATAKETEEYYHYLVHETPDLPTIDYLEAVHRAAGSQSLPQELLESDEFVRAMRERFIVSSGVWLIKGGPDEVAAEFKDLSDAGLDGMAFSLPNYLDDLPVIRDEVIPRLERMGLRIPLSEQ